MSGKQEPRWEDNGSGTIVREVGQGYQMADADYVNGLEAEVARLREELGVALSICLTQRATRVSPSADAQRTLTA